MKKNKRVFVDINSMSVHSAVIFMVLSAIFRLAGSVRMWSTASLSIVQIIMPLACNLLFILFIMLFGKKAFFLTSLPVVIGCVHFIIDSFAGGGFINIAISVILYASAAILFCCTAFGWIRTKWLVAPLFLIILVYSIVAKDLQAISDSEINITFSTAMLELSSLFTITAFFFTSVAMKNKLSLEEAGLPKMKGPKVVAPTPSVSTEEKAELQSVLENIHQVQPESAEPPVMTAEAAGDGQQAEKTEKASTEENNALQN